MLELRQIEIYNQDARVTSIKLIEHSEMNDFCVIKDSLICCLVILIVLFYIYLIYGVIMTFKVKVSIICQVSIILNKKPTFTFQ